MIHAINAKRIHCGKNVFFVCSVTTYFHDDIEESSSDDENNDPQLEDDYSEVPMDIVSSPNVTKTGKEPTNSKVNKAGVDGDNAASEVFSNYLETVTLNGDNITSIQDRRSDILTDTILSSPAETKKSHMTLCPVCYEIAIISKHSHLYDNIILACMEKNKQNK